MVLKFRPHIEALIIHPGIDESLVGTQRAFLTLLDILDFLDYIIYYP